ncbi:PorP/SprF family type IX secretion system membrane protein [Flexithrix dorotheae]|uniref:PorP/SprF family type IX secretion system membrane protein n=1 Tax=Flexithrix dorotheae TaxID=70993 RepID=UPI0009FC0692|nr:type IX secretion system membrane protein PorP/SprF [Flexithrix dorotheae]
MSSPRKLLIIILTLVTNQLLGQVETQFTQYMFNEFAINPAFAGSAESLNLTGSYRTQWTGVEGAPTTQTFSGHTPLNNENIGIGLLVLNDQVGIHKTLRVLSAYSYKIKLDRNSYLSLGVQAGLVNKKSEYSSISSSLQNQLDPTFLGGDYNELIPEFGGGLYFNSKKVFAGLSVPNISAGTFRDNIHGFLYLGGKIGINKGVEWQPSLMVKAVENTPINVDINSNIIFNEVLWLGVSLRSFKSVNFLAQVQATPQLRIGYSYDTNPIDLNSINGGAHEIVLNFRFTFFNPRLVTPRHY